VPISVTEFISTPNPNAVKCLLDQSPTRVPRSYFSAVEAKGDTLGEALFAVPGVKNLLIHDGWITVSKDADADWKAIKAAVVKVLAAVQVDL